jgi:Winged helix-turn-helix DNA-binding
MFFKSHIQKYSQKQKKILELLEKKKYMQKDLAESMKISGAGLLYHLKMLEDEKLILKITTQTFGGVSLKEISLNPLAMQNVRMILGIRTPSLTLISGMGKDNPDDDYYPSKIPSISKMELEKENIKISRVCVFLTPESDKKKAKKHVYINKFFEYPYQDYRNEDSIFINELYDLLESEIEIQDIILDLTPLTKFLTIKFMEFSSIYNIPCFYLGESKENKNFPIWIHRDI